MQIEIFKVGTHTSNSGQTIEFTPQMLKDAVSAYDPSIHEAPVVIGHPKDGAPAYGWIKSVSFDESAGKVVAELDQVDDGFKELVNSGRYKKRSASWYGPESPANPKPGSLYLRHLGFLGAQPPAIKGMPNISFNESEDEVFEFGEKTMFEQLKAWIAGKFGQEEADKALPTAPTTDTTDGEGETESPAETIVAAAVEAAVEAAIEAEAAAQDAASEPNGEPANEPGETADYSEKQSAADALAIKEAELAAREQAIRATEISSFCEGLIAEGKLLPAEQQKVAAVFGLLYKQSEQFDFSEDGTSAAVSAADVLKDILKNRPAVVSFSEVAAEAPVEQAPAANFTVASGFYVNPDDLTRLAKLQEYAKANNCDIRTAALKNPV